MATSARAPLAFSSEAGQSGMRGIFQEAVEDYKVELLFIQSKYEAC